MREREREKRKKKGKQEKEERGRRLRKTKWEGLIVTIEKERWRERYRRIRRVKRVGRGRKRWIGKENLRESGKMKKNRA